MKKINVLLSVLSCVIVSHAYTMDDLALQKDEDPVLLLHGIVQAAALGNTDAVQCIDWLVKQGHITRDNIDTKLARIVNKPESALELAMKLARGISQNDDGSLKFGPHVEDLIIRRLIHHGANPLNCSFRIYSLDRSAYHLALEGRRKYLERPLLKSLSDLRGRCIVMKERGSDSRNHMVIAAFPKGVLEVIAIHGMADDDEILALHEHRNLMEKSAAFCSRLMQQGQQS